MSPQLSHKTKLTAGNTVSYCAIGHRSIANIWIQSLFEVALQNLFRYQLQTSAKQPGNSYRAAVIM